MINRVRLKFESNANFEQRWPQPDATDQGAHSKMMQSGTARRGLTRDGGGGRLADVMALAHSLLRDAAGVTLYRLCPTTVSASLPLNAAARAEHESERPVTPESLRR